LLGGVVHVVFVISGGRGSVSSRAVVSEARLVAFEEEACSRVTRWCENAALSMVSEQSRAGMIRQRRVE
jgi:hypothetical protein